MSDPLMTWKKSETRSIISSSIFVESIGTVFDKFPMLPKNWEKTIQAGHPVPLWTKKKNSLYTFKSEVSEPPKGKKTTGL